MVISAAGTAARDRPAAARSGHETAGPRHSWPSRCCCPGSAPGRRRDGGPGDRGLRTEPRAAGRAAGRGPGRRSPSRRWSGPVAGRTRRSARRGSPDAGPRLRRIFVPKVMWRSRLRITFGTKVALWPDLRVCAAPESSTVEDSPSAAHGVEYRSTSLIERRLPWCGRGEQTGFPPLVATAGAGLPPRDRAGALRPGSAARYGRRVVLGPRSSTAPTPLPGRTRRCPGRGPDRVVARPPSCRTAPGPDRRRPRALRRPGLWDMHAHGIDYSSCGRDVPGKGVTGIREMEGYDENRATRDKIVRGELLARGSPSPARSSTARSACSARRSRRSRPPRGPRGRADRRSRRAPTSSRLLLTAENVYAAIRRTSAAASACRSRALAVPPSPARRREGGQRSFEHTSPAHPHLSRRDEILARLDATPFDPKTRSATSSTSPASSTGRRPRPTTGHRERHFARLKALDSG